MGILLVFCGTFAATRGERLPRLGQAVAGALIGLAVFVVSIQMFWSYNQSFRLESNRNYIEIAGPGAPQAPGHACFVP